jgi:hypothetical protein
MKQFIAAVNKNKIDELMAFTRHLCALRDLKSTLSDTENGNGMIYRSQIKMEDLEKEISHLAGEKEKKLEEIRSQQGWSREEMSRMHLMENAKVYMDRE